jgi:hypothetical protein
LKTINLFIINGGVGWISKNGSIKLDSLLLGDAELALEEMLKARSLSPQAVPRQDIFYSSKILDLNSFIQNVQAWTQLGIKAGDAYISYSLMSEFLLPEFRSIFLTDDQYQSWKKELFPVILAFGQSIESFFLNSDGTLDYLSMIESVKMMIVNGVMEPLQELTKLSDEVLQPHVQYPQYLAFLPDDQG